MKEASYVSALKYGVVSQFITRGFNYLAALVLLTNYTIEEFGSIQYSYFQILSISTILGLSIRQSYSYNVSDGLLMSKRSKYTFIIFVSMLSSVLLYVFPEIVMNAKMVSLSFIFFMSEYYNVVSFAELEGKKKFRLSSILFSILSVLRFLVVCLFIDIESDNVSLLLFIPSIFLTLFFMVNLNNVERGSSKFTEYINVRYHVIFMLATGNLVLFNFLLEKEKGEVFFGYYIALDYVKNIFIYLIGVASTTIVPYLRNGTSFDERISIGAFSMNIMNVVEKTILLAPLFYFAALFSLKYFFEIDEFRILDLISLSVLLFLSMRGDWKVRLLLGKGISSASILSTLAALIIGWVTVSMLGFGVLLSLVIVEIIRIVAIQSIYKSN